MEAFHRRMGEVQNNEETRENRERTELAAREVEVYSACVRHSALTAKDNK